MAVGYLEETVAKAPDFYRAWYNLSLAYRQLNRPEDAARAMEKARGTARNPRSPARELNPADKLLAVFTDDVFGVGVTRAGTPRFQVLQDLKAFIGNHRQHDVGVRGFTCAH